MTWWAVLIWALGVPCVLFFGAPNRIWFGVGWGVYGVILVLMLLRLRQDASLESQVFSPDEQEGLARALQCRNWACLRHALLEMEERYGFQVRAFLGRSAEGGNIPFQRIPLDDERVHSQEYILLPARVIHPFTEDFGFHLIPHRLSPELGDVLLYRLPFGDFALYFLFDFQPSLPEPMRDESRPQYMLLVLLLHLLIPYLLANSLLENLSFYTRYLTPPTEAGQGQALLYFLMGVMHELLTPLQRLQTYFHLLPRVVKDIPSLSELHQQAMQALERIQGHVDFFQSLAQVHAASRVPMSLRTLERHLYSLVRDVDHHTQRPFSFLSKVPMSVKHMAVPLHPDVFFLVLRRALAALDKEAMPPRAGIALEVHWDDEAAVLELDIRVQGRVPDPVLQALMWGAPEGMSWDTLRHRVETLNMELWGFWYVMTVVHAFVFYVQIEHGYPVLVLRIPVLPRYGGDVEDGTSSSQDERRSNHVASKDGQ